MTVVIYGKNRGKTDAGWLQSQHTFSFGSYNDPSNHYFGVLRVINEDIVQPSQGFGTHSHQDMEIVSIVLKGQLEHKDSLGNGSTIRPGDVQRMTAGTGIEHSEFNPSNSELAHFIQIWIRPKQVGLPPSYEQKAFLPTPLKNQWALVGSEDGREGSVMIHQDLNLYQTELEAEQTLSIPILENRMAWLQVVTGNVHINHHSFSEGDGIGLICSTDYPIIAKSKATLLLFEMAYSDRVKVAQNIHL